MFGIKYQIYKKTVMKTTAVYPVKTTSILPRNAAKTQKNGGNGINRCRRLSAD